MTRAGLVVAVLAACLALACGSPSDEEVPGRGMLDDAGPSPSPFDEGREHADARRLDEALAAFERAVLRDDHERASVENILRIHAYRRDLPAARETLARLAEARPSSPDLHSALGRACRQLGDLPRAVESFARALELAPAHGPSLHGYGSACLGTGDYAPGSRPCGGGSMRQRLPMAKS